MNRCRRRVEVLPQLVGHHPSLGPDGPAQRQRERPGAGAGLQYPGAGRDVRLDKDGAHVLRVDHLGAPRHLEDEVGQPGPEAEQASAGVGVDDDAFLPAQDQIVRDRSAVEVEGGARLQPK